MLTAYVENTIRIHFKRQLGKGKRTGWFSITHCQSLGRNLQYLNLQSL